MEALKKRYLAKTRKAAIICMLVGIVLGALVFKDWLPIGQVQNIDTVKTVSEIHEGRAQITVYYIWDYFMYYTDDYSDNESSAVARDYFVLCGADLDADEVDSNVYIGVHLEKKQNKRAYAIMEELWGEEEPDWDNLDYFTVKGHVRKLDSDEQEAWDAYRNDFIAYGATAEELDEAFAPYIFVPNRINLLGMSDFVCYLAAFLSVLFLAIGLGNLVQSLFGDPLKAIEKYGSKHNGTEAARAKAESLLDRKTPKYDMLGDDDMFIYVGGASLLIEDPRDVLWAYEKVVTRKSGFITVGKDYSMVIRFANGKQTMIASKENEIQSMLRAFHDICPDAIVGFNNDINRDYIRNRQAVIAEVARRRQVRLAEYGYASETVSTEPVMRPVEDSGLTTGDIFDTPNADPFAETAVPTAEQAATEEPVTASADDAAGTDNDKLGGFFS